MKLSITTLFTIALALTSHSTRGEGAHVHGLAELNIAIEGKNITAVLESPAEGIYGFETEAKTKEQKKAQDEKLSYLKLHIDKLIQLDTKLQCSWKMNKVAVVQEGHEEEHHGHHHEEEHHEHESKAEHRSVEAEWNASCKENPSGSVLKIDFGHEFSNLKRLKVNILKSAGQSSSTLKSGSGEIKL